MLVHTDKLSLISKVWRLLCDLLSLDEKAEMEQNPNEVFDQPQSNLREGVKAWAKDLGSKKKESESGA